MVMQMRLQQVAEAEVEARRVKAAPVPPTVAAAVVPVRPEPRPLTVPEPFQLQSEVSTCLGKIVRQAHEVLYRAQLLTACCKAWEEDDSIFAASMLWYTGTTTCSVLSDSDD